MRRRRVELYKTGGPEALRLVEDEAQPPRASELQIAVRASGVAFADVMMRHGKYPGAPKLPYSPGYDVVGTVEAIGSGVSGFALGDAVVALTQFGGYADHVCVAAERALSVPRDLDPVDAVCLVLNYVSAYQMLHHVAEVQRGQRVLVHSAAGGVGTALLQLGRDLGLTMYGTASKAKHAVVEANGGIPIDYRNEDVVARVLELEPGGVDAAFDPIGPASWRRSRECVERGGHVVAFGMIAGFAGDRPNGSMLGALASALAMKTRTRGRRFSFYNVNFRSDPGSFRRDLEAVLALYRDGAIKPVVGAVLPLAQAAEAHRLLASGQVSGKIVLAG